MNKTFSYLLVAILLAGGFASTASAAFIFNFSGTITYQNGRVSNINTPALSYLNGLLNNQFQTYQSTPTVVSLNTGTLIAKLNKSSYATNIIFNVTGKMQIPSGSYIIIDVINGWNGGSLAITNRNGFFLPLEGESESYEFADLYVGDDGTVVGASKQNALTGAGSETDTSDFWFFFDDGNGTHFNINGPLSISLSAGASSSGKQTVSGSANGIGAGQCFNGWAEAIGTVSWSGSDTWSTNCFPFWRWWND